ncbi:hypothetical protein LCL90_22860 [Bacillus infantis]|uniref:hypothetical protein n=1 Tax=Bacillus infantis TaxID=324767 RepID=UPI001CD71CEE|nr:hypothetical protein [Bacillus infantis]MCA1037475.1 hypothetical protein [Bacillus infantis]HER2025570.1 hypothetical protein [Streptococcus pyogenes]
MSRADDIKSKIQNTKRRDPRGSLMGPAPIEEENKNVDVNDNINVNNNVHVNNNEDGSLLSELVSGKKTKKKSDTLINSGIYFEPDVYEVLQSLAKKGGRGAKSRIVNESLRKEFIAANLLPKKDKHTLA